MMRHIGDLQPLQPPDFGNEHALVGRYSVSRSRWRFAVGSWEMGFDRASEQIQAETARGAQDDSAGLGERLMIRVGMVCVALLVVAITGWLWSPRGPALGGNTVSAGIIDRGVASDRPAGLTAPQLGMVGGVASTGDRPAAFLSAVIEKRAPAPVVQPTPHATVQIAHGGAIKPRAADEDDARATAPDDAVVKSGNFLLIPNVEQAVGLALRSGEAQSWMAGAFHGVVVVGDAVQTDGKSCRDGTILLRDGTTQGRTQRFKRCL